MAEVPVSRQSPILLFPSTYGVLAKVSFADQAEPPMVCMVLAQHLAAEVAHHLVESAKAITVDTQRPITGTCLEIWDDRLIDELVQKAGRHQG